MGSWIDEMRVSTVAQQRNIADDFMGALGEHFDKTLGLMMAAGSFIESSPALMQSYGGVANFRLQYPFMKEARNTHKKRLDEMRLAIQYIHANHAEFS